MADKDERGIGDPANRTRLAWSRTSIAFAAIGVVMLKWNPVAGGVVLALSIPIWIADRRTRLTADGRSVSGSLRLVTATIVLGAVAALLVVLIGRGPQSLSELLHGR